MKWLRSKYEDGLPIVCYLMNRLALFIYFLIIFIAVIYKWYCLTYKNRTSGCRLFAIWMAPCKQLPLMTQSSSKLTSREILRELLLFLLFGVAQLLFIIVKRYGIGGRSNCGCCW